MTFEGIFGQGFCLKVPFSYGHDGGKGSDDGGVGASADGRNFVNNFVDNS